MWLLFVEIFLFVLIAFTLGVVVGLVAVRVGVRRTAPARPPRTKEPKVKGEKRRGRKSSSAEPETAKTPMAGGAA